jgi:hypothetical protein
MVGFTLLSRSHYYLRRRSPGPPFPPDHRQAGERGAINNIILSVCLSPVRRGIEPTTCFSLHHAYTPRNWCPHSHCVSYSSTASKYIRAVPGPANQLQPGTPKTPTLSRATRLRPAQRLGDSRRQGGPFRHQSLGAWQRRGSYTDGVQLQR